MRLLTAFWLNKVPTLFGHWASSYNTVFLGIEFSKLKLAIIGKHLKGIKFKTKKNPIPRNGRTVIFICLFLLVAVSSERSSQYAEAGSKRWWGLGFTQMTNCVLFLDLIQKNTTKTQRYGKNYSRHRSAYNCRFSAGCRICARWRGWAWWCGCGRARPTWWRSEAAAASTAPRPMAACRRRSAGLQVVSID